MFELGLTLLVISLISLICLFGIYFYSRLDKIINPTDYSEGYINIEYFNNGSQTPLIKKKIAVPGKPGETLDELHRFMLQLGYSEEDINKPRRPYDKGNNPSIG